jgi:hypothetical protein
MGHSLHSVAMEEAESLFAIQTENCHSLSFCKPKVRTFLYMGQGLHGYCSAATALLQHGAAVQQHGVTVQQLQLVTDSQRLRMNVL